MTVQSQLCEELRKILSKYLSPEFVNDAVEKFGLKVEPILLNHGVSANQGANLLENKYKALADKFVQLREQQTKKTTDIIKTVSLQTVCLHIACIHKIIYQFILFRNIQKVI